MTVWFTSDLHLGHRGVAMLRDFVKDDLSDADVETHDDVIEAHWIAHVKPDDVVWVLGDICMSRWTQALERIGTWPGRKRLITGNHDAAHPMHSKAIKATKQALEVFEYVAPFARIKVHGQPVLLSHFPYTGEGTGPGRGGYPDRHPEYRLRDTGMWLLHGHTHDKARVNGSQIHVGVDAWDFCPVADDQIRDLMADEDKIPVPSSVLVEDDDEVELCAVCRRDVVAMAFRGTGVCSGTCRKTRDEILTGGLVL